MAGYFAKRIRIRTGQHPHQQITTTFAQRH
uniref:Uncharacterized protein n=1 Tax=Arundo donax TaxID=35708 RepID=A0A0A8Y0U0_ARUDO